MTVQDQMRSADYAHWLAAIVESSDDAILSKDLNGIITSWNPGAQRLFGYAADEVIGKSILILIPAGRQEEEEHILNRIRHGERVGQLETVRRRKDGSVVDIALTVSPIRDPAGQLVGASKIARDISERNRLLEQHRLLVHEMKHRVKNTLAIVQAIASQTLRDCPKPARETFQGRLQALARAHDLVNLQNWAIAPVREIVERALAPFQGMHRNQILLDGEDGLWLEAGKVSLLSMGLHELATNAAKYGALSATTGRVHLSWRRLSGEGGPRLKFEWRESGGPPVAAQSRTGFGMRLLKRVLHEDFGNVSVSFEPQGLVCTLEMASLKGNR
ncbi:PAS domain S-box protein [Vineibacter terrae]|uniref:sensor histidine kinase n=1 Tax=Vineibacter terrae TaxID=2586908 RepID=UPI002E31F585|nr:PAS domain S-box protein [Vineibacter terrae]HEX2886057.1 PAS domain S-box protein [Vineibacter terrae]